jgi:hypothetical protein
LKTGSLFDLVGKGKSNGNFMRKIAMMVGLLMVLGAASMAANAQSKVNVRFKKGTTLGSYNGSITGARYIDYVMKASGGQTLRVVLTKRSGAPAVFNVLPYGSDVAIADDARQSTSWKGVLPSNGTYVVRVYLEKGDRQNGRSSSFKIGFSIEVE